MQKERNVLGGELMACSFAPLTGYFRDGSCATHGADGVAHLVCVKVTAEFDSASGSTRVPFVAVYKRRSATELGDW